MQGVMTAFCLATSICTCAYYMKYIIHVHLVRQVCHGLFLLGNVYVYILWYHSICHISIHDDMRKVCEWCESNGRCPLLYLSSIYLYLSWICLYLSSICLYVASIWSCHNMYTLWMKCVMSSFSFATFTYSYIRIYIICVPYEWRGWWAPCPLLYMNILSSYYILHMCTLWMKGVMDSFFLATSCIIRASRTSFYSQMYERITCT